MKIKIRDNVQNENIIKAYKNALDNLDEKIVKLIEQKNYTMLLTHSGKDIRDDNSYRKNQKEYVEDMMTYPERGSVTNENKDNAFYIAVFEEYLQIEHLEAILYHEIGHFLDGFTVLEQIDPDLSLFLSGSKEYQEAYKLDFKKNWDKIRNDKRFRLIHYIQDSTPHKINKLAVAETFAESFGVINGKKNDEKTVELYFANAIEIEKELLNKTYGIEL